MHNLDCYCADCAQEELDYIEEFEFYFDRMPKSTRAFKAKVVRKDGNQISQ